jgi:hypothetical protein
MARSDKFSERIPYASAAGDYSCRGASVEFWEGGRFLKVRFSQSEFREQVNEWNSIAAEKNRSLVGERDERRGRSVCRGFSYRSQSTLRDRLNQISCTAERAAFVTLTLPDGVFMEDVEAFAKYSKLCLQNFLKRLRRACPAAAAFWRIEWKRRKSGAHEGALFPHFHLLVWGLPERVVGRAPDGAPLCEFVLDLPDEQGRLAFVAELDAAWGFKRYASGDEARAAADGQSSAWIVGDAATGWRVCVGDSVPLDKYGKPSSRASQFLHQRLARYEWDCEGRDSRIAFADWSSMAWYHVVGSHDSAHFKAGARVENLRSWKGVVSYCSKYLAKEDWEGDVSSMPLGRQWGICNRECVPWAKMIVLPLTDEQGVQLRRVARRYLEHRIGKKWRAPYSIKLYVRPEQFSFYWRPPPDCPF